MRWLSVNNRKGSDKLWGDGGQDDITGEYLGTMNFHLSAEQRANLLLIDIDITGGHNVLFGEDGSDMVYGGNDEDTLIGDNGRILREGAPGKTFPWDSELVWVTFPAPFNAEAIRKVRLFDDVDKVEVCKYVAGAGGVGEGR
jgi:RTX calcium-binding nonapeptide repeat (4 copies)